MDTFISAFKEECFQFRAGLLVLVCSLVLSVVVTKSGEGVGVGRDYLNMLNDCL